MKNICRLAIAIALSLQVISCGKKNNDPQATQTAIPPMSLQSCNQNNGYSPYGGNIPYNPYQWNNNYNVSQAGFCGCSYGQVPACNPGVGMFCVPVGQNSANYALYNYNNGNFNFNNYGGYSGFGANNSCTASIGQICQAGVVGSCGYGRCVQMVPGNPYGICANY